MSQLESSYEEQWLVAVACPLRRTARLTEAQNVGGWKGPLWVITLPCDARGDTVLKDSSNFSYPFRQERGSSERQRGKDRSLG